MEYDIIRQLNGFVAAVSVPGRLEVLNSCLHCSPLYPMIVFTRSITPPGVCPSIPAAGCQHGLFSCVENAVGLSRSVDSLLNPFAVRRTPHSSSYSSRPPCEPASVRRAGRTCSVCILVWLLSVCCSETARCARRRTTATVADTSSAQRHQRTTSAPPKSPSRRRTSAPAHNPNFCLTLNQFAQTKHTANYVREQSVISYLLDAYSGR